MKLKQYLDVTPIHGLKTKGDRYRKFARKLGISYGTLSGWMSGRRPVRDNKKLIIVRLTRGMVGLKDL